MHTSDNGALVDRKNNAIKTSELLLRNNISSLLSDEVVTQLKFIRIRQIFSNVTSNYPALAVHRTHEAGQYGSTLTIEIPQGDITVDGSTFYASAGVLESLNKVAKVSEYGTKAVWSKLTNVEIHGEFNIDNEEKFQLEELEWNIQHEIPNFFNITLVKYEECPMTETWQSNYCKNSSSHTTQHLDFPNQRFFSEKVLWSNTANGFYEKSMFSQSVSGQHHYKFSSSNNNKAVYWIYDTKTNKTGDCSLTTDQVPSNILIALKNEVPTYMCNSYQVNDYCY